MPKDKQSLDARIEEFKTYFKDDLDAIDEELGKSQDYSKIIDEQIDHLKENCNAMNKGSQHYLIEHITNAVQLQSQRQSLRKDKFSIKKAIMDYAAKFADDESKDKDGDSHVAELINKLLEQDRTAKQSQMAPLSEEDIDAEIDKVIKNEEE